jgi:hypothetical protein
MARKTLTVTALRDKTNSMLAAEGSTPEGRIALAVLLESVLFETGNYHGFNYQASEKVEDPQGERVLRKGYDDTRRVYY